MRAVWYESFGEASEVLRYGEREAPVASAGEVLVRVRFSAVHPSDTTKRSGALKNLLDSGHVIPHSDGSGEIEAVGEGVSSARIGERVWFYQAQYGRRFGAAAEYVSLESRRAVVLPEGVDFETGASLGIPAMTAHRCIFSDGEVEGRPVLVTGGAGRVGCHGIQWAVRSGAHVIATASSSGDRERCLSLGAKAVVDHRCPGWGKEVLRVNGGRKVDRVVEVDFGTNLGEVLGIISNSGVIASYSSLGDMTPSVPFYRMMFKDLTLRMVLVYAMPEAAKEQAVADIGEALRLGCMSCRIAEVHDLECCARAHQSVEAGSVRGSVLVRV